MNTLVLKVKVKKNGAGDTFVKQVHFTPSRQDRIRLWNGGPALQQKAKTWEPTGELTVELEDLVLFDDEASHEPFPVGGGFGHVGDFLRVEEGLRFGGWQNKRNR